MVAAEWALPDDVSRRALELSDDVAATAMPPGTAPTGHIGVLVALGQVIRDPCDDGTEEDREAEDTFGDHSGRSPVSSSM